MRRKKDAIADAPPHVGLIMWWSTYHQRWHWTSYQDGERKRTEVCEGKPILSDERLLERINNLAARLFPERTGTARVVESAYSAIWLTDEQIMLAGEILEAAPFLQSEIEWLVCHSL